MLTLDQLIRVLKLEASLGGSVRDGCPSDASRPGGGNYQSYGHVLKQAAVNLIIKDGLILGITRRHDKTKYGLPGGKRDETDASVKDAAIREAFEECGVVIKECVFIYKRVELGDGANQVDFESSCFYATDWEGEPKDSEEGNIAWLTVNEVTNSKAAFGDYNTKTLEVFRRMYPDIYLIGE